MMRRWVTGTALLLALFAAAVARADAADPETDGTDAPAASAPREAGAPQASEKIFDLTLESLSATRLRPLFARDRSPPRSAAAPAEEAAAPEPEHQQPRDEEVTLSLQGIVLRGETRLVILKDHSTSNTIMLRSGEKFGRWQVIADNDHSATLISEDGRQTMDIFTNPESTIKPE